MVRLGKGVRRRWLAVVWAAAGVACGQQQVPTQSTAICPAYPCPLPLAITVNVLSASGGAVQGAFVQVAGAMTGATQCSPGPTTICYVMGTAGTYTLWVGAPGYQSMLESVTVVGTSPVCGCPVVETQLLTVILTPTLGLRRPEVQGRRTRG